MKLLTKTFEKSIPPLYSTENVEVPDKIVVGKFFDPSGSYTLYIVEGQREEDDYTFWGYVTGLAEDEFGYTSLKELDSVRGRLGLGLERDIYWAPKAIREIPALSELLSELANYEEQCMKPILTDKCVYDVCNDYSLDICTDVNSVQWSDYNIKARVWGGSCCYHKVTDELHYFIGEFGLEGKELEDLEDCRA